MDITQAQSRFSSVPMANIQRSVFGRPSDLKTTHNFGKIIPLDWDEVLPGDTMSRKVGSLIRMSTPLFPVMDNAFYDIYSFFIPLRLIWNHSREFFGENRDSAWTSNQEYFVPGLDCVGKTFDEDTIFDYFGLPTKVVCPPGTFAQSLPLRAYVAVWNDWFRYEVTDNPIELNLGDDDSSNWERYRLLNACKLHDYFTSALPAPQAGDSVGLVFNGGILPVLTGDNSMTAKLMQMRGLGKQDDSGNIEEMPYGLKMLYGSQAYVSDVSLRPLCLDDSVGIGDQYGNVVNNVGVDLSASPISTTNVDVNMIPINLYADLNQATVSTINQLRQAIVVQQLLERTARSGNRYTEYVRAAFGVVSPDSRLQRTELIGHIRININMQQVVQTSFQGGSETDQTPLGSTGAFSKTNDYNHLHTYSATEHGIILTLGVARTELTYQQGLDKKWSRRSRYDYYDPIFNGIGEQAILNKELYFSADADQNEEVFGYQEAYGEYRYKQSKVTGAFRSNHSATLDSWHYAEEFDSLPTLSSSFIHQGDSVVDRTLAVASSNADQLLCNFWWDDNDTRPMPIVGVPGLNRI